MTPLRRVFYLTMKILIAMDSFKGSLTSAEADTAVAEGLREVFPDCEICCLPASDGGEGMIEAFIAATGGTFVSAGAHDALMRPCRARYGLISGDVAEGSCSGTLLRDTIFASSSNHVTDDFPRGTAVMDMASEAGLEQLAEQDRNPMLTSTYGFGEVIADALSRGCRHFVVGVGGSATNDAGLGMMEALGARFYASDGSALSPCGGNLSQIARIDLSGLRPELCSSSFVIACDVRNPFCGSNGAARVFAPQKGASAEQVELLEEGMCHIAEMIRTGSGIVRDVGGPTLVRGTVVDGMSSCGSVDLSSMPGAGAAGGLAGAFYAFLGASLRPGVEVFTEISGLETRIASSDLVVTGEGKADAQTLMGKLPSGVLSLALRYHVPAVLVAGLVENHSELLSAGFSAVFQATPFTQVASIFQLGSSFQNPTASSTSPLADPLFPSVARRNLTDVILRNHKILCEIAN